MAGRTLVAAAACLLGACVPAGAEPEPPAAAAATGIADFSRRMLIGGSGAGEMAGDLCVCKKGRGNTWQVGRIGCPDGVDGDEEAGSGAWHVTVHPDGTARLSMGVRTWLISGRGKSFKERMRKGGQSTGVRDAWWALAALGSHENREGNRLWWGLKVSGRRTISTQWLSTISIAGRLHLSGGNCWSSRRCSYLASLSNPLSIEPGT